MAATTPATPPRKTFVQKGLSLFTEVRQGEEVRALKLVGAFFLLLTAYYVIKTVREPMLLADGSAELKAYASGGQAIALLFFVPFYGWVASKLSRGKLILGVCGFFLLCLQIFFVPALEAEEIAAEMRTSEAAAEAQANDETADADVAPDENQPEQTDAIPSDQADAEAASEQEDEEERPLPSLSDFLTLGYWFYVWVGIFSLATIAQFWSFANDIYNEEQGKRLFPLIAIGSTVGAAMGSAIPAFLFDQGVSSPYMLQIAFVLLFAHAGLLYSVHRSAVGDPPAPGKASTDEPLSKSGGFGMIFSDRYLFLIATVIFLLNVVNTLGEYLLSDLVVAEAVRQFEAGEVDSVGQAIGAFYGKFFLFVNIATVSVQALAVSRIVKHLGLKGVLFALPIVALGTYGLAAIGVGFAVFRASKMAENTTDYSVMNTGKALLWLPTSREAKYKAKQAIDTFVVRLGDLTQALVVFVGTTWFAFGVRQFALLNVVLILLWLAATVWLLRLHTQRSAETSHVER
ncbi:MAG: AAA family ATP:ADP antiporter [Bradymonadia bacterium]|jgi:AAA family ATP:ADP antiporter